MSLKRCVVSTLHLYNCLAVLWWRWQWALEIKNGKTHKVYYWVEVACGNKAVTQNCICACAYVLFFWWKKKLFSLNVNKRCKLSKLPLENDLPAEEEEKRTKRREYHIGTFLFCSFSVRWKATTKLVLCAIRNTLTSIRSSPSITHTQRERENVFFSSS